MIRRRIRSWLCLALLAPGLAWASEEPPLRMGTAFLSPRRGDPYQGITLPAVMTHQAVYDTLTTVGEKGEIVAALAVAWTAESPRAWVLELRRGVTFSNGEPFTAQALVASAAYLSSPKGRTETIGSTLYQVDRVEALDELTARVILNEPDPLFPLHAAAWRVPAPVAFANLGSDGMRDNPIGTGPFVVKSWVEGRVVMAANPRSWRAPHVGGLDIREIPDETARLQALVSGAVDFAMGLASEDDETVRAAGGTLVHRVTPMVNYLAANTVAPNAPLRDPRVRLALNLAVNRQALIDSVLDGATDPAAQLTVPGAFGYDPTLKPYPYDPDRAKALLIAAGYKDGLALTAGIAAGMRASDTLYYQQIAADLAKVGVTLALQMRPQQVQMQEMFAGTLPVDLFTMFTRGHDALQDYRHRTCAGLTQGRAAFHCDPLVVSALKATLAETNTARRATLYRQVARVEYANPPGIILWQGVEFDGLGRGVSGYAPVFEDLRLERLARQQK